MQRITTGKKNRIVRNTVCKSLIGIRNGRCHADNQSYRLNNRGMSLVETIVTLVITSIVLASLGGLFLYLTGYFKEFSVKKESKMITDSVFHVIEDDLTYATDLYISHENTVPDAAWVGEGRYLEFTSFTDPTAPGRLMMRDTDGVRADLFGDIFYENGSIQATITRKSEDSLLVQLTLIGPDGVILYERERTISLLNMGDNIETANIRTSGASRYDNEFNSLFLHVAGQKKIIQPSPVGDELLIWKDILQDFQETVKTEPKYYVNLSGTTTVNGDNGTVLVRNPFSVLAYQYSLSEQAGEWPKITNEILGDWELQGKISGERYMLPYHYRDQLECDVCFIASQTDNPDELETESGTQLLFLQEENSWYYFELNDAKAIKALSSLELYQEETGSFTEVSKVPFMEGSVIRYADSDGVHQSTIRSSYQVKLFFKTYGHQVAKKEEEVR